MALRRRFRSRRRPLRRLRPRGVAIRRRMPMRRPARFSRVAHFKTTVVSSVNVPIGGLADIIQFDLAQTQLAGEITALYKFYRINKVVVKYVPTVNVNAPGGTSSMPACIDYTSPEPITGTLSFNLAVQQRTHRIHNPLRTISRKLTPALTSVVATSATGTTFVGSLPKYKQWIETSATGIPHFGYACLWGNSTGAGLNYNRYVKYYVSAKWQQ